MIEIKQGKGKIKKLNINKEPREAGFVLKVVNNLEGNNKTCYIVRLTTRTNFYYKP